MNTKKNIIDKLNKDINKVEYQINHTSIYNFYVFLLKLVVNFGITLDKLFPYIISAALIANSNHFQNNKPFNIDKIPVKPSIEVITTSNGITKELISYEKKYNKEEIEYSTGWTINKQGLYERKITTYYLERDIDEYDIDAILNMSKNELESLLKIKNIEIIKKNTLSEDDYLYEKEGIIIINHYISDEEVKLVDETILSNIFNSTAYIALVLLLSKTIKFTKKICLKVNIKDELNKIKAQNYYVDFIDREQLIKVLEIKKQNLEILKNGNKTYTHTLRKI